MPRMSQADAIAHEERVARGKLNKLARFPSTTYPPAERETGRGGLHEQIMQHCNSQWPRWKYIHSRTDQKSTVEVGSHDFTVFIPGGKTLCVECKAKGGKFSNEQLAWAHEMKALGHSVYGVYSLNQFLELVATPPSSDSKGS